MDDSKQMFSSKLSSELVCVPVSPLNMGAAWENLECCINYVSIIMSCLLQAPKCGSWKLLFLGVLRGYSVSRQRHVETKMQLPETLTWALQPCPVSRGSQIPCPALLHGTSPVCSVPNKHLQ